MKMLGWLALILGISLHAAEPRYQLRSLIQNDGTLLHVRMDTQTGKTWRLDRVLKNRLAITLRGKPAARELERTQINIGSLNGFTLQEVVVVLNRAIKKTGNERLPKVTFAIPAKEPVLDPKKTRSQLVPPSQPQGGETQGIDPTTGLPLDPRFPERIIPPPGTISGTDGRPIDPSTGLPIRPQFPRAPIDPVTGLPLAPTPQWQPPQRKDRVELFRIRNWPQKVNQSAHTLLTQVLNSSDSPLRCVIDEKTIYLTPESSIIIVSGGNVSQPEYTEKWVEIKSDKPE
jgi:hypothetical protein